MAAKVILYSACKRNVTLYEKESWPVKEGDVIRLKRNDAKMVRLKCNIRAEDRISAV